MNQYFVNTFEHAQKITHNLVELSLSNLAKFSGDGGNFETSPPTFNVCFTDNIFGTGIVQSERGDKYARGNVVNHQLSVEVEAISHKMNLVVEKLRVSRFLPYIYRLKT